jgi:hypothetical protein
MQINVHGLVVEARDRSDQKLLSSSVGPSLPEFWAAAKLHSSPAGHIPCALSLIVVGFAAPLHPPASGKHWWILIGQSVSSAVAAWAICVPVLTSSTASPPSSLWFQGFNRQTPPAIGLTLSHSRPVSSTTNRRPAMAASCNKFHARAHHTNTAFFSM